MSEDKLTELIRMLCNERGEEIPVSGDKFRTFRALVNVRPPKAASEEFLRIQDEYLQEEIRKKGITDIGNLAPIASDIYLWRGDITTLRCDGIVNAANSQMLGCFCPNHECIDNAVHTYAGVQLRCECAAVMDAQGHEEQTGRAKITKAYNLPCKYVLHTVGPVVYGELTEQNERDLQSCYRSCLSLADEHKLKSIAFCCISTGVFRFPNDRAAQIAVNTVTEYKRRTQSKIKVLFNVFKEYDHEIYARLLGTDKRA